MDNENVLGLPETTILNIAPDDILLVKTDRNYTRSQLEKLSKDVKHLLPRNKIMIVPDNIEFFVIPASDGVIIGGVTE